MLRTGDSWLKIWTMSFYWNPLDWDSYWNGTRNLMESHSFTRPPALARYSVCTTSISISSRITSVKSFGTENTHQILHDRQCWWASNCVKFLELSCFFRYMPPIRTNLIIERCWYNWNKFSKQVCSKIRHPFAIDESSWVGYSRLDHNYGDVTMWFGYPHSPLCPWACQSKWYSNSNQSLSVITVRDG